MNVFTQKTIDYINSIESADERYEFSEMLRKAANKIARKSGFGRATKIDIRKDNKVKIIESNSFGWAKDSTGERVPMAYVNKCMGRGVHYEHAVFEVQIGTRDLFLKI